MSVDCRVSLPLGTRSSRVFMVLGRALGVPVEFSNLNPTYQTYFGGPPRQDPVHPDQPCAKNNCWALRLSSDHASIISNYARDPMAGCNFMLVDLLGQKWEIPFSAETLQEDGVLLLPDSTAVGIALGIRLVRFFGGKVVYNDGEDGSRPDNRLMVDPARSIFPPMRPGQDDHDRFHQFQNALVAQMPLDLKELNYASSVAAYPNHESSRAWMDWTRVESQRVSLETRTGPAPKAAGSAPRL